MPMKTKPGSCCASDKCCNVYLPDCITMVELLTKGILVEVVTPNPYGAAPVLQEGLYKICLSYESNDEQCILRWMADDCTDIFQMRWENPDILPWGEPAMESLSLPCSFARNSITPFAVLYALEEEFFCEGEPFEITDELFLGDVYNITLIDDVAPHDEECDDEVTDCTGLSECEDMQDGHMTPTNFENYIEPYTFHYVYAGGVTGNAHWLLENLIEDFTMPYDSGTYEFEKVFYTPTGDYSTASTNGKLIRYDTDISITDAQYEAYVYKLRMTLECSGEGDVTITDLKIYFEHYTGVTGVDWPTQNGTFNCDLPAPTNINDVVIYGNASGCRCGPTYVRVQWHDDPGANSGIFNPLDPVDGVDHEFNIMANID